MLTRATSRSFSPGASTPACSSRWSSSISPVCRRSAGSESWKDVGIRPPAGVVERRVEKGTEQKSRAVLVFTGPMRYDTTQTATLRAMAEVLQTRLRDALREDLGGHVRRDRDRGEWRVARARNTPSRSDSAPRPHASRRCRLASSQRSPASRPRARRRRNWPTSKPRCSGSIETNSRQNGFVLTQLMQTYENGDPPDTPAKLTEIYRQLTAQTHSRRRPRHARSGALRQSDAVSREDTVAR